MFQNRAIELFRQCEAELRRLLASAAETGDYDSVIKLTAWAKQISVLAGIATSSNSTDKAEGTTARAAGPQKRSSGKLEYPHFGLRGDSLIKVGWSKREKKEYEHKAPKRAAVVLADALLQVGANGRIFQASDVLPLTDPEDGTVVPDYQAYLILAWFRNLGLVDQHGRQGYSLTRPKELTGIVESAWQSLSEL